MARATVKTVGKDKAGFSRLYLYGREKWTINNDSDLLKLTDAYGNKCPPSPISVCFS